LNDDDRVDDLIISVLRMEGIIDSTADLVDPRDSQKGLSTEVLFVALGRLKSKKVVEYTINRSRLFLLSAKGEKLIRKELLPWRILGILQSGEPSKKVKLAVPPVHKLS